MIEFVVEPARTAFLTVVLCLTRMTVASLVVPFLGGESVQLPVRVSILVSLGLMLYPLVGPTVPPTPLPVLALAGLFLKEAVLGFLMGFLASKVFWVALGVGMVVDNQRGATIAESLDPASNEQVSPFGQCLQQAVIALFYCSGGFLIFVSGLYRSYAVWPVFSFVPEFGGSFCEYFLHHVDDIMRLTVVLASPMLITLFVTEFGLGLINRFAPQLNVFFLAMPIKSLVAFVVLVFYLPYLVNFFLKGSLESDQLLDSLGKVIS